MSKFAKFAIPVFVAAALAPPVIAQAKAGLVVLDVRKLPCSNIEAAKDVMGDDENAVQEAGASACSSAYRVLHRLALPKGARFTVIWRDGTKQDFFVTTPFASLSAVAIPGTVKQKKVVPSVE